jgi:hypothetical protein
MKTITELRNNKNVIKTEGYTEKFRIQVRYHDFLKFKQLQIGNFRNDLFSIFIIEN